MKHFLKDYFKDLLIIITGICFSFVEIYHFLKIIDNPTLFNNFFILHIVLSFILLVISVFLRNVQDKLYRNFLFFCLFFIVSGFIGGFGYLIFYLIVYINHERGKTFLEIYEELFLKKDLSFSDLVYEDIKSGRKSVEIKDVISFRDVLTFGSPSEKREVLSLIIGRYIPLFAPILIKALSDDEVWVRVSAALAMANIENSYLKKTIVMKKMLKKDNENGELWLRYALLLDDYAYCGFLDKSKKEEILSEATEAYRKAYDLECEVVSCIYKIARTLIRSSKYQEAFKWIRKYYETTTEENSMIDDWYIECLYELSLYDELKKMAKIKLAKISEGIKAKYSKEYLDALALWKE